MDWTDAGWWSLAVPVVSLVVGLVIGRLTAPQRATVMHWAPIVRSLVRRIAARNPKHTAADVAAEVVSLVCEELGVAETDEVHALADEAAVLELLTVDASKGGPD